MTSDLALAREHLELAWVKLAGDDTTGVEVRQAIAPLLDRVATAEHRMNLCKAEVPAFRPTRRDAIATSTAAGVRVRPAMSALDTRCRSSTVSSVWYG